MRPAVDHWNYDFIPACLSKIKNIVDIPSSASFGLETHSFHHLKAVWRP